MKASKVLLPAATAVALIAFACGQDYNSNSGDERYGPVELPAGVCEGEAGARFCAAQQIISKRCFGCHSDWSRFDTSQKWIDSGRIEPGQPDSSLTINRLINAGGDMPQGGPALPSDEYNALREWISNL
jgi:hypothetical protein